MFHHKIVIAIMATMLTTVALPAAELTGIVTDNQTGQPVPGAMIKLTGFDISTVSNSEGEFSLQNVPPNANELVVTQLAYEIKKAKFAIGAKLDLALTPKILRGQDVIVTAGRASKGESPAAFADMSRAEIAANYWAQDTPMLLSSLPNIFAYSDAGNGIGYSYLELRGFNQNRVSVMVNGIPLNGAESHEVYWVDLPSFADNVQDIQVQRGVGTSVYGQSALGGSVNLITNDFSAVPTIKAETGYGSYNTRKLSISGNSGLINDSYVFYGRFSKIQSDGYRDNSWVDMYSYFMGVARYDKNMTWKFNTYGGPEELHLAYKGIPFDSLATNRKFNELTYPDEIDHFNQPHYEFLHEWNLDDNLKLENTLYYFTGEGYYNQYRTGQDLAVYDLGAFYDFDSWNMYTYSDTTFPADFYANLDSTGRPVADTMGNFAGYYQLERTTVDIVRKPWVKEYDWGWIPRLTVKHDKGVLTVGGEIRLHGSHHWGEITWADYYPAGYQPDNRYHDYRGKSNSLTVYLSDTYKPIERLTVMVNLQYQHHNYKLEDDQRYHVAFDRNYDFFSPRAGAIYQLSNKLNVYINASTASRQPAFQDIYDPQDFWSNPDYRRVNFITTATGYDYIGKELKPEKLFDLELGANLTYKAENVRFDGNLNLYRMRIKDEIVPYAGQLDDMNVPISGNAPRTLHQGVELSFNSLLNEELTISGNLSFIDNHFVDYTELDWEGNPTDLADKQIGGFPSTLANYRLGYDLGKVQFGIGGRYVGKQYIDNNEQYELDSYHIINGDISYSLNGLVGIKSLKATLRMQNIANTKYEQAAYMDDGPRYIVGAERNIFVSLMTEF